MRYLITIIVIITIDLTAESAESYIKEQQEGSIKIDIIIQDMTDAAINKVSPKALIIE